MQSIAYIALVVRDYKALRARGTQFVRELKTEDYGTVAVLRQIWKIN